jgi:hypothetical protein
VSFFHSQYLLLELLFKLISSAEKRYTDQVKMVINGLQLRVLIVYDALEALVKVDLVLDTLVHLRFDLGLDLLHVLAHPLRLLELAVHRRNLVWVLLKAERHGQGVTFPVQVVFFAFHNKFYLLI